MKKIFKTAFATILSCACLFGAAACANKSECNAEGVPVPLPALPAEDDERARIPDCPICPEVPNTPPCYDGPETSEEPKQDQDGQDERPTPRPYPIKRRQRIKLLPFEIIFGESEEGFYYVFLPAVQ